MNLRFSGIPEIQNALVKSLVAAREYEKCASEIMAHTASPLPMDAPYHLGRQAGKIDAWTEAAVSDPQFPEFITRFGEHLSMLFKLPISPMAPGQQIRTLTEGDTNNQPHCPYEVPGFCTFATALVKAVFYQFEPDRPRTASGIPADARFSWDRLQRLLNSMKPEGLGPLNINFYAGQGAPTLAEKQTDGSWRFI